MEVKVLSPVAMELASLDPVCDALAKFVEESAGIPVLGLESTSLVVVVVGEALSLVTVLVIIEVPVKVSEVELKSEPLIVGIGLEVLSSVNVAVTASLVEASELELGF